MTKLRRMFWPVASACAVMIAVTAQAEIIEGLKIELQGVRPSADGRQCLRDGKVIEIEVVMDGDDGSASRLFPESQKGCTWIVGTGGSASTERSYVSLRIGPGVARTECHKIQAGDVVPNMPYKRGVVRFDCCNSDELRRLKVDTDPPMPVSYVRDVAPIVPRIKEDSARRPCLEDSVMSGESRSIDHAQFDRETIYLQIAATSAARRPCGLILNDLSFPEGGRPVQLTQDGVFYRFPIQRAERQGRIPPNSIELDARCIKPASLNRLTIKAE